MLKRNKLTAPHKKKKGQSTVEYVILVAAVLAAIIWFVVGDASPFRQSFEGALQVGADQMDNFAERLNSAYPNQ